MDETDNLGFCESLFCRLKGFGIHRDTFLIIPSQLGPLLRIYRYIHVNDGSGHVSGIQSSELGPARFPTRSTNGSDGGVINISVCLTFTEHSSNEGDDNRCVADR